MHRKLRTSSTALAASVVLLVPLAACEDDGDGIDDDVEQDVEDDIDDVEDSIEDGVDDVEDTLEEELDGEPDDTSGG